MSAQAEDLSLPSVWASIVDLWTSGPWPEHMANCRGVDGCGWYGTVEQAKEAK